ncbi:hypothetical protein CFREI_04655 [Corynebacterium freiburgense]|nr:hypothetical protein CFREI_04655 [Corynebacterium freiburgense]
MNQPMLHKPAVDLAGASIRPDDTGGFLKNGYSAGNKPIKIEGNDALFLGADKDTTTVVAIKMELADSGDSGTAFLEAYDTSTLEQKYSHEVFVCSDASANDLVYCSFRQEPGIFALDVKTGERVAEYPREIVEGITQYYGTVDGNDIVLMPKVRGALIVLSLAAVNDGQIFWEKEYDIFPECAYISSRSKVFCEEVLEENSDFNPKARIDILDAKTGQVTHSHETNNHTIPLEDGWAEEQPTNEEQQAFREQQKLTDMLGPNNEGQGMYQGFQLRNVDLSRYFLNVKNTDKYFYMAPNETIVSVSEDGRLVLFEDLDTGKHWIYDSEKGTTIMTTEGGKTHAGVPYGMNGGVNRRTTMHNPLIDSPTVINGIFAVRAAQPSDGKASHVRTALTIYVPERL